MIAAIATAVSAITVPYAATEQTGDDAAKSANEAVLSEISGVYNGELRLFIHRNQALAKTEFNVKLKSVYGSAEKTETVQSGNLEIVKISMDDINDDEYELTVSAPNYLTYTQKLEFSGQRIQLDLYNDVTVNEGRNSENGGLFGVIPVGDLNGDGEINDEDADMVKNAVGSTDSICDITGDGEINLDDIAVVVRNNGTVINAAPLNIVSSSVLAENVSVSVSENTKVKGDLPDLLGQAADKDSRVTLSSTTGESISADNPVEVVLAADSVKDDVPEDILSASALLITPPKESENYMTEGIVEVEGIDLDTEEPVKIVTTVSANTELVDSISVNAALMTADDSSPVISGAAYKEKNGTVVINLGSRVAIKKVTIRVTATANQNNLAEIAAVEFLGDFAERIPEPQLSVPTVKSVSNTETDRTYGTKSLTVEWEGEPNVTKYEVNVSGNGLNKTASVSATSYTFLDCPIRSFLTYKIKVRSVNGSWKSDWSNVYEHTATCNRVPSAPQGLSAVEGVMCLNVSWNDTYDAEWYTLYYKKEADSEYTAVKDIKNRSYTLTNLDGGVNYIMYVVAHNRNGDSPDSSTAKAKPKTAVNTILPKYKLINTENEKGIANTHITSISSTDNNCKLHKSDGTVVNISDASFDDWNVILDNDPNSYCITQNSYFQANNIIIQMDEPQKIRYIRMTELLDLYSQGFTSSITYKTKSGKYETVTHNDYLRLDSQNNKYIEIVLNEPIITDYIEIPPRYVDNNLQAPISEVRLYEYDPIEGEVENLFSDEIHTVLKNDVTESQIQSLIERVNIPDEISGELNPRRDTILAELNYAMQYLHDNAKKARVISLDSHIISENNSKTNFSQGLSTYQPLGVVAAAGETIVIYTNSYLFLSVAQYHPESSTWTNEYAGTLYNGRNEITIPRIGSYDKESGGSLYVRYGSYGGKTDGTLGGSDAEVRVIGGTEIPILNVAGITGDERIKAIRAYVKELESYAGKIEDLHKTLHDGNDNDYVNYPYSETDCFLNSTEITIDNMMYSIPALAVWNAIKDDPVNKLINSIAAMEQEIDYMYQFKGMNKNNTYSKAHTVHPDAYPFARLNIRYHQPPTGAYMYAGSNHIGMEYASIGNLFNMTPIKTDENGKYVSGRLSEWSVAHEIGHCINDKNYEYSEVTNNIFAQLAKTGTAETTETNANFRTSWDSVYKAVASGTAGHTVSWDTQLAMYWQLHLAYDNNYAYKMYDDLTDQKNSLFYARLDSYLRNNTVSGDKDQKFMKAACAAASKNLLPFFEAWGFEPDANTITYASALSAENRKIQYIDDDSRLYRIDGGEGMSEETTVSAAVTNAENSRVNDNRVTIQLSNNNTNENAMLGYEIKRNGKVTAFVPASQTSYDDIVTTENNRTLVYTVTGIDRLLNETEPLTLPEIKVCHDGAIDKSLWTIFTDMASPKDTDLEVNDENPDADLYWDIKGMGIKKKSTVNVVADNDKNTVYYGSHAEPYVTINLGKSEYVSALKFTPASADYSGDAAGDEKPANELYKNRLFKYSIDILEKTEQGTKWKTVKKGSIYTNCESADGFDPKTAEFSDDIVPNDDGSYTIYLNQSNSDGKIDPFMYTYDTQYVRLSSYTSPIAIAEVDILGPTSDNVDLISEGFGKLTTEYNTGNGGVIPKDSIVFYGSYRGDPSYNVVLLKDQDGKTMNGSQLLFAEVPDKGALGQTSNGRWIFWLENLEKTDSNGGKYNEYAQLDSLKSVKAELYRVQDANTLDGQRLTSTTLTMAIPEDIPDVVITDDSMKLSEESAVFEPSENMVAMAMEASVEHESQSVIETEPKPELDIEPELESELNIEPETEPEPNIDPETEIVSEQNSAEEYSTDTLAESDIQNDENTETTVDSPIRFNVDDKNVNIDIDYDATAIAVSGSINISSKPDEVMVDILNNDKLYKAYNYSDGVLTFYTVARTGNIGSALSEDNAVNYTVSDLSVGSTLTVSALNELDSKYSSTEKTVNNDYSVTIKEKPIVPTENPVVPTENPVVPTENPVVPTENPVVPTENPIVPTENPVVPTENPIVPTENPVVPTENPIVPTENPIVPTEKPIVPTENPIVPTENPVVPTENPIVPTENPIVPTEKPVVPTEKPIVPTENPIVPTENPVVPTIKPTEKPTAKPTETPQNEHINAIGKYKDILDIEKTVNNNNVTFTIKSTERDVPEVMLFVTRYNKDNALIGVEIVKGTVNEDNVITIKAAIPTNDKFKLMLWDKQLNPLF